MDENFEEIDLPTISTDLLDYSHRKNGRRQTISERLVLPPRGLAHSHSPVAGTPGRHPIAGPATG